MLLKWKVLLPGTSQTPILQRPGDLCQTLNTKQDKICCFFYLQHLATSNNILQHTQVTPHDRQHKEKLPAKELGFQAPLSYLTNLTQFDCWCLPIAFVFLRKPSTAELTVTFSDAVVMLHMTGSLTVIWAIKKPSLTAWSQLLYWYFHLYPVVSSDDPQRTNWWDQFQSQLFVIARLCFLSHRVS